MTAFERAQHLHTTLSQPFYFQANTLKERYPLWAEIGPSLFILPFLPLMMWLFYAYGIKPYYLAISWIIPFGVFSAIALTGLYLWISSQIAQRLQGALSSKPITSFAFSLPEDLILDKEGQTLGPSMSAHSKLILVEMLKSQGFQALVVKHQRVYYL